MPSLIFPFFLTSDIWFIRSHWLCLKFGPVPVHRSSVTTSFQASSLFSIILSPHSSKSHFLKVKLDWNTFLLKTAQFLESSPNYPVPISTGPSFLLRSHLLSRPFLVAHHTLPHIRTLALVPSVARNLFFCFMVSTFSLQRFKLRYHLSQEASDHPAQSSPKSIPIICYLTMLFISFQLSSSEITCLVICFLFIYSSTSPLQPLYNFQENRVLILVQYLRS